MSMKSPLRGDFKIHAMRFGDPSAKTVALVGAMRGDEIQQVYIASQVVKTLRSLEERGMINDGCGITVIPAANPFSLNIGKRFWALDNTDINRMFPGYARGETTQRIADSLFGELEGYDYGLQLASFYESGFFTPHVRMIETGYEDTDSAALLGLPYVLVSAPRPYDTTLLNYNWQLWNTKAYSLYAGLSSYVNDATSRLMLDAIIKFMARVGALAMEADAPGPTRVISNRNLVTVKAEKAGIFYRMAGAPDHVDAGAPIADIIHPLTGETISRTVSPVSGEVFFASSRPLSRQGDVLFKIVPDSLA